MESSQRSRWREEVLRLAAQQDDVVTATQLRALGVARSTISGRARLGHWSQVLPGVLLVTGGRPDRQQRERAALLYSSLPDSSSLLCGRTALRRLGVRALRLQEVSDRHAAPEVVNVLVPHNRHLTSMGFAEVTRTRRWPDAIEIDGLPQVTTARAVADVARTCGHASEVMQLVSECVDSGLTTDDELLVELRDGARQRSALLRSVLVYRAQSQHDRLHQHVTDLVRAASLPDPRWRPHLVTSLGEPIGSPLAWIDCSGLALDVASNSPEAIARLQRFAMFGIPVYPLSLPLLTRDPVGQARTLARAADRAAQGVRNAVVAA